MEDLKQSDPISVLAGLECDLNDLDYRLTGWLDEYNLPPHAVERITTIRKERDLAADALARVKDRLLSVAI
jgi:hypothetical protein